MSNGFLKFGTLNIPVMDEETGAPDLIVGSKYIKLPKRLLKRGYKAYECTKCKDNSYIGVELQKVIYKNKNCKILCDECFTEEYLENKMSEYQLFASRKYYPEEENML